MEEWNTVSKFGQELSKQQKGSLQEEIKKLLDEESYQDFLDALKNSDVPSPAIVLALKPFGIEVSENTIRRWRKVNV